MLLDSASLYFRAFYGVPTSVKAPNGMPINAARGLLDFIARLVTDHQPTHLIAAWDNDWRPDFRVDLIPSYKAHRVAVPATDQHSAIEEVPDELTGQLPVIERALELLGITRVGVDGYEADDVIATLATQAEMPVAIVTGDRDLFQLVDELKPVRVLYTAAKGVGAAEVIDDAAIVARYGIHAAQYADFALLRGDPSDGLPGVKGVGDKTAASLVRAYGSVNELVAALGTGKVKMAAGIHRSLLDGLPYLELAAPVVRVARDVPVPVVDAGLPQVPSSAEELVEFAEQWGLTNSIRRVATAFKWIP